jgi:hypothetical protein
LPRAPAGLEHVATHPHAGKRPAHAAQHVCDRRRGGHLRLGQPPAFAGRRPGTRRQRRSGPHRRPTPVSGRESQAHRRGTPAQLAGGTAAMGVRALPGGGPRTTAHGVARPAGDGQEDRSAAEIRVAVASRRGAQVPGVHADNCPKASRGGQPHGKGPADHAGTKGPGPLQRLRPLPPDHLRPSRRTERPYAVHRKVLDHQRDLAGLAGRRCPAGRHPLGPKHVGHRGEGR